VALSALIAEAPLYVLRFFEVAIGCESLLLYEVAEEDRSTAEDVELQDRRATVGVESTTNALSNSRLA
jgi:hypothetical protein